MTSTHTQKHNTKCREEHRKYSDKGKESTQFLTFFSLHSHLNQTFKELPSCLLGIKLHDRFKDLRSI